MGASGKFGILAMLVVGGAILASGCGTTPPSRFYLLSSVSEAEPPAAAAAAGVSVAVTVTEFPEYLNQSRIVTRRTQNRLELDELDRWAAPLREDFARVVTENLSLLLGTPAVTLGPVVRSRRVDYTVAIEVSRFDVGPEPEVRLVARWTLLDPERRPIAQVRKSDIAVAAPVEDRDAQVAAQSEAVGRLSREIAEQLRSVVAAGG